MDDVVVIGAGIVGLATARALLTRRPDWTVTVLERAPTIATGQTGHNSGVIHTGIYYEPGSLKARLCRAGEAATKEFCRAHGIPHHEIGKLIVATTPLELTRMADLAERAVANGIETRRIGPDELRELEPHVSGLAALLVPRTGIVDYREVARAMASDIERLGGRVLLGREVRGITERNGAAGPEVTVDDGFGGVAARRLVACAGVQADRVARMGGVATDFRIVPFRGEYFQLPASRAGLVDHLIYPVPDPELPFLGIHLTPTIDGRTTIGPNAVLGLSREGRHRGSVRLRDVGSFVGFPGMWRFAAANVAAGLGEMRNSLFRRSYLAAARRYCPDLELTDLRPHPAGIRAQAILRDGTPVHDFLFHETAAQVHTCNAPSPAATSAIPIGELIADRVIALG